MTALLNLLAWLAIVVGLALLAWWWVRNCMIWPFTFPWRLRRAMVQVGLVRKRTGRPAEEPRLHRKRREGAVWHLVWIMPTGVSTKAVEAVREALEERWDCSLRVWADRGKLHMRAGLGRLPDAHLLAEAPRPTVEGGLVVHVGMARDGMLDADLTQPPHTLIGGTSGGGKTACVQSMVLQLARTYTPAELQLALVDLKGGVDMSVFDRLPHLRWPVAGRHSEVAAMLSELVMEQERRQDVLRAEHCPNIGTWNRRHPEARLPYIVAVIDEFAELLPKDAPRGRERDDRETAWAATSTLTRMGRASGVHVVIATQRPDHEVLPGQIRANCGRVIAGRCETIFNAEILLGPGQHAAAHLPERAGLAIHRVAGRQTRVQIAYMAAEEIEAAVEALQAHYALLAPEPPRPLAALETADSREEVG